MRLSLSLPLFLRRHFIGYAALSVFVVRQGVSAQPSPSHDQLVAEASIWNPEDGYAYLPVTIHGQAATIVLNLNNERDLSLSTAALARLGIPLTDTTVTQLDSLGIGADIQHHIPLYLIQKPTWAVAGPPQLPPVVGVMGVPFLITHYDLLYDLSHSRVRLYTASRHVVSPHEGWLPPGIKPTDCGRLVRIPSGAATFTGMELQLDGHPLTGVLEMGPYYEKMNQDAFSAMGLTAQSPNVKPVQDLPAGYSRHGYVITQQVEHVHLTIGTRTFWTGTVQFFPELDVDSALKPVRPVMLMTLNTIRDVLLFNSVSSGRVCISAP